MTDRQIAGIRTAGLIVTFLVMLLQFDPTAKESVNRPDVFNPQSLIADMEEAGDWCWTGGSDLVPNVVVYVDLTDGPNGPVATISDKQKVIDRAIEQEVFGVDHGMEVYAFCQSDR